MQSAVLIGYQFIRSAWLHLHAVINQRNKESIRNARESHREETRILQIECNTTEPDVNSNVNPVSPAVEARSVDRT